MNKKKKTENRILLKLVQGLTGAVFAVSAFMLPVTGFAERVCGRSGDASEICDAPGAGVSGSQPGGSG